MPPRPRSATWRGLGPTRGDDFRHSPHLQIIQRATSPSVHFRRGKVDLYDGLYDVASDNIDGDIGDHARPMDVLRVVSIVIKVSVISGWINIL